MNLLFRKTNPDQLGCVSLGEMCATSEDMILSTVQNDFIHYEPRHTSLNSEVTLQSNITLPQTNIIDIGNTSFRECYVIPKDMISCETDMTLES